MRKPPCTVTRSRSLLRPALVVLAPFAFVGCVGALEREFTDEPAITESDAALDGRLPGNPDSTADTNTANPDVDVEAAVEAGTDANDADAFDGGNDANDAGDSGGDAGDAAPSYALQEDFDGVTTPSLPAGWTTAEWQTFPGSSPTLFVTTTGAGVTLPSPDSAPNCAAIGEYSKSSDVVLTSPSFTVTSSQSQLTFRHAYTLEAGQTAGTATVAYDGAVLEISTNDGATWTDIVTAGGMWSAGGYDNRVISACCENPGAGRTAWSGRSTGGTSGWKTTTVSLPLAADASARIRFRLLTDKANTVSPFEGWRIDSVAITN
jgi:hypothetical protein